MLTVTGRKSAGRRRGEAGFSLIELMVALGVTLVIMVIATRLLSMSMFVRQRENQRSEAVADVQRALQAMSREISNAGLGMTNNGLVAADSNDISIRIRSNLNAFCGTPTPCDGDTAQADEDVVFTMINNNTGGEEQKLLTRQDVNTKAISPLANRVDGLSLAYLKADGTAAATPSAASRVRITVTVDLPAVGSPNAPGYQPASRMRLISDALLRNNVLTQ